jgi:hypothetical protein
MPDYLHDVVYKDILSSAEGARAEATDSQIYELRRAFNETLKNSQD